MLHFQLEPGTPIEIEEAYYAEQDKLSSLTG